jgi:transposase
VFRAKRTDRVKLIYWDGTGLCLFAKRLEDGIFRWPKIEDGVMRLSAAQLSALGWKGWTGGAFMRRARRAVKGLRETDRIAEKILFDRSD